MRALAPQPIRSFHWLRMQSMIKLKRPYLHPLTRLQFSSLAQMKLQAFLVRALTILPK
jgi:hypothetical protein